MKKKTFILFIFHLLVLHSYAQEFVISNSRSTEVINKTDLVEVYVGALDDEKNNC